MLIQGTDARVHSKITTLQCTTQKQTISDIGPNKAANTDLMVKPSRIALRGSRVAGEDQRKAGSINRVSANAKQQQPLHKELYSSCLPLPSSLYSTSATEGKSHSLKSHLITSLQHARLWKRLPCFRREFKVTWVRMQGRCLVSYSDYGRAEQLRQYQWKLEQMLKAEVFV